MRSKAECAQIVSQTLAQLVRVVGPHPDPNKEVTFDLKADDIKALAEQGVTLDELKKHQLAAVNFPHSHADPGHPTTEARVVLNATAVVIEAANYKPGREKE